MSLIEELKRRNVFRVGVAYVIVAWLLLQVADVILPTFRTPDWVMQAFTVLLFLGLPLALILAWAFELTPEGLKKEKDVDRSRSITHVTGRKLDFAIIAMLVVALGYFAYDKFVPSAGKSQDATNSIAVLAFDNMSDDPGNESFSDGISEEILNLLAKVPELRVTSRSSAFSFKGQNLDVPTMAAKLNVAHVLEGSVRKSGNQLRITAQLIEAVTDTHLWSETYDREFKNVFAIQDEIAAAVVDALKITLLGEQPKSTDTDPQAYALYLQARHFTNQDTAASIQQAETLLKQALLIDPGFAPALTELADVYLGQAVGFGLIPFDEGAELARQAIQKALEIDPHYGRSYDVLARVAMFYDWDFEMAFQHLQQALKLNPYDADILRTAGFLDTNLGRLDEANDLLQRSIALDPVSAGGHYRLAQMYYLAHRLDEAEVSFHMALSLNPGGSAIHYMLSRVALAQGDVPAALAAIEQETSDFVRVQGMAIVQHALGDTGASDAALRELIECCAAEGAYQVAAVHAFRGEIDDAFDWLEQAYDNRDGGLIQMLLDPLFANLYDDPRWEPFLDKMGLPH